MSRSPKSVRNGKPPHAQSSVVPPEHQTDKPWRRRASPLARQALAWWVALVMYGSLYPMTGWTDIGVGPFAYLSAPIPRWLTPFDLITNVLGYVPLGVFVVLAVYPRLRGASAVLAALLSGVILSGAMEAVQTYLPTRVASNLDLATNAVGALIGGVVAAPFVGALLDRGWLRRKRFQWFERHSGKSIALLLLWPLAQMYPQPFLLGIGDWPRRIWDLADPATTDAILDFVPGLSAFADAFPDALASWTDSHVWEAIITTLGVLGAGLFASLPIRAQAPRYRLIYGMLISALVVKTVANGVQSSGDWRNWFDWTTDGAITGLLAGALILPFFLRQRLRSRALWASATLLVSLLLVNLLPLNPYWPGVQMSWRQGEYRHLNDLAQWLAGVWPYAALLWLAASAERDWLSAQARRRRPH
ncbi:VanZ family protein [Robbsia andropogonis]|uniref:VanZ family protein n=1 Tax=Robbsia andropogonis TaxID=28092 RepID=UPI0028C3C0EC|nr:VanZ family protein [Robbsia andropogonis]